MTLRVVRDPHMAAQTLAAGGLLGLPTETVYGLAADARNETAIARVFTVKGRPNDHPLIVHMAEMAAVTDWAVDVSPAVWNLLTQHWPGPLTVVLRKRASVSGLITGGQSTVAVRMPDSPAALQTIAELGRLTGQRGAVVAPSANRFGAVSPTSAAHVQAGLGTYLNPEDAVLDAGMCRVGVESTIVDASAGTLRILRPGAVTVSEAVPLAMGLTATAVPRVPGSLASHYAPAARVVISSAADIPGMAETPDGAVNSPDSNSRIGLIAPADVPTPTGWHRLAAPLDDVEYARHLYAALRAADAGQVQWVYAVLPTAGAMLPAITDRLQRAAGR